MRFAKALLPANLESLRKQLKKLLPPERVLDSISLGLSVAEEAVYVVRNAFDTSLGFSWKLLYGSDYHRRRLSEYRHQKRLLIMVPGYMQSPLSFQRLEHYLSSEPFDVFTYIWGDFPYSQDITLSAAQLAKVLEEVYNHTSAQEIYLLGHSQGGIIIRVVVQHRLAAELPVRKCLFLSSPHQGTWVGLAAVPHRGVRRLIDLLPYVRRVSGESGVQLLPGSSFLKDLNSRPLPEGIQFSSIFYSWDPMIWPPSNAILPYPEARNFYIRKFGHAHPLYCPQVARLAARELYGQVDSENGGVQPGC